VFRFLKKLGVFGALNIMLFALGCQTPSQPKEIVLDMPAQTTLAEGTGFLPEEIRDESVYRWMSGAFRIENRTATGRIYGSGTLCYYDKQNNIGYVISCGHLFHGNETHMFLDTWYKNGVKLATPARYTAEVICHDLSEDIAFFKFTLDWVPSEYFPIAPITKINAGTRLWSVGCDGGNEVATYNVRVVGMEGSFLITRENSPRRGRSGGGLMSPDGWYMGICVRSSDPDNGTGTGLFVPLSRIHPYAQKNGLGFLLNLSKKKSSALKEIPVVDRIEHQGNYPPDYIPIP
jgi:hypothetical protein